MYRTNKHFENKQIRLQNWDYRWDAAYFITLNTKNRERYFGSIENGKMELSKLGVIADIFWHEIKNHGKDLILDEFVVMPDHIHGIIILDSTPYQTNPITGQNRFQNIGKNSLSSLIGSYKSAVSKHARRLGFEFQWQARFYDSIIRDKSSIEHVRKYIRNNPAKWNKD